MTIRKFFDEETPEVLDLECYINNDSPDIEHFLTENENDGVVYRAIVLTVLDVRGEPSHSAYDLESLNELISGLTDAKESLTHNGN